MLFLHRLLALSALAGLPLSAQGPVSSARAAAVLRDVPVFIPMDSGGTPVTATPPGGGEPVVGLFFRRASATSFVANLQRNQHMVANNSGFSDSERALKLYKNTDRHTLASLYQRDLEHYDLKLDQVEEIQLTTVDLFCAKHGIDRLHFLKIDIEGHELSALKGAARMIAEKRIDFIQFEFGGANVDSRTYFRDFYNLLKTDFKLFCIVRDGQQPIEHYYEGLKQFNTINYLAEKR